MATEYARYIDMALVQEPKESAGLTSIELPIGIDESIRVPLEQIVYVDSLKTVSLYIGYHALDSSRTSVRDTIECVIGISEGAVLLSSGESVACAFGQKGAIVQECLGQ